MERSISLGYLALIMMGCTEGRVRVGRREGGRETCGHGIFTPFPRVCGLYFVI